jgi:glucosamine-6-phosphate deaminase
MEPGLQLERFEDAGQVAERVATLLLEERRLRPGRPMGLATGRTMEPVYRALARLVEGLPREEADSLRRQWCSFNLDEYVGLGPDQGPSFAAEMGERLIRPLGLDPARVHLPDGRAADPQAEAERYGAAVAAAGGLGLQLLGLGLNGHLGFNEPPCAAEATSRVLALSPCTRQQNAAAFGGDPAAVPSAAITLGLREILAAERLLLVVTGAAKAEVLAQVLEAPPSPELPASWIRLHPAVRVVADLSALPP